MKYCNINDIGEKVTLREAVLKSVVKIRDLYMPETIPVMPGEFIDELHNLSFRDIALKVSDHMLKDDVPYASLQKIINDAFNFEIPLKQLSDDLFVLELFHGPTLAFKDVGARFMAGLFEEFIRNENKEVTILVATSGDTGSAVASAFYNRKGIRVFILYPSGRVSMIQEKQLTTMGGNIKAFEVDGDFDDCQRLVKTAFSDTDVSNRLMLTSANSINFARLFPQSFYYFYALGQLPGRRKNIAISVPSGNFGNLTAGLLAMKMGLPVHRFIASTNVNHSVPDYLENGIFAPDTTIQTITNAMDVGNPSNFPRILSLFNGNHNAIRKFMEGYWFTDEETRLGIRELYEKYSYLADPHGAVGYLGIKEYSEREKCTGIFLETAHPCKFSEKVEAVIGSVVKIPDEVRNILDRQGDSVKISSDYEEFRNTILNEG